ncbi:MAG TPA: hypothetical protein VFO80_02515 [Sphingomonas sp.]|nr:hypothetical protein [Sphingomonas sp.]
MTKLTLTITRTGMERFTAAQLGADIDLTIATIGLTDAVFVVAPTLTALPGEFRRLPGVSGEQVGDNIVHMTMRDEEDVRYTARGFGLFLADGTLFAVYGQADRLFEKSPRAAFLAAVDIAFPTGDVSQLTFGSTDFLNPPATTATKGVVRLATDAQADAGMDLLVVTARQLKRAIDAALAMIAQAMDGLAARTTFGSGLVKGGGRNDTNRTLTVDAASVAQIRAGTALDVAITPGALRGAYVIEQGRRVTPDGFVEMWGIAVARATEGAFDLVFPTPFTTACEGVMTMTINTMMTADGLTVIQEVGLYADRAALFAQNHQNTLTEVGGFRWRAWGR